MGSRGNVSQWLLTSSNGASRRSKGVDDGEAGRAQELGISLDEDAQAQMNMGYAAAQLLLGLTDALETTSDASPELSGPGSRAPQAGTAHHARGIRSAASLSLSFLPTTTSSCSLRRYHLLPSSVRSYLSMTTAASLPVLAFSAFISRSALSSFSDYVPSSLCRLEGLHPAHWWMRHITDVVGTAYISCPTLLGWCPYNLFTISFLILCPAAHKNASNTPPCVSLYLCPVIPSPLACFLPSSPPRTPCLSVAHPTLTFHLSVVLPRLPSTPPTHLLSSLCAFSAWKQNPDIFLIQLGWACRLLAPGSDVFGLQSWCSWVLANRMSRSLCLLWWCLGNYQFCNGYSTRLFIALIDALATDTQCTLGTWVSITGR
ncbi:hypothetical protein C7M84_003414 [Penaeus vannamei]|uniref:Uncharacterized protein n=1 Tax=Penaeus vannamei TaxID=6689 RepID=A0A3R7QTN1_PENVA|nr:hypothetical protein C7M84_003414 [Penaeus vannamei]